MTPGYFKTPGALYWHRSRGDGISLCGRQLAGAVRVNGTRQMKCLSCLKFSIGVKVNALPTEHNGRKQQDGQVDGQRGQVGAKLSKKRNQSRIVGGDARGVEKLRVEYLQGPLASE